MEFKGDEQEILTLNTALHFFDAKLTEAVTLLKDNEENLEVIDPVLLEELKSICQCFTLTDTKTGEVNTSPEIDMNFVMHIGINVCALGKELNTTLYKAMTEVDSEKPLEDTFLQLVTETEGDTK